jgi:1-acyl-sn-glycerol-3-phosphate acyltransferase
LRKGISVLVFPEGTFNETGLPLAPFFDGAFRIAIETATPLKPVLILDTYDRMPYHTPFSLNPGQSRAVFLDEIPVKGLTPEDIPALKEQAYQLMADKLRAYKASWIKDPLPSESKA